MPNLQPTHPMTHPATSPTKGETAQAAKLFDDLFARFPYHDVYEQIGTMQHHRMECDEGAGLLSVTVGVDGDMHAGLCEGPRAKELHHFGFPSFRARTFQGGGRHERTRKALMLLALAMKADAEPYPRT